MSDIKGEMSSGVNGDLECFKALIEGGKGGNDRGLMGKGGVHVLQEGEWPWRLW
jgi:hypothetical protein